MRKIKVAFCTDGVYPQMLGGMQKHSRLLVEELSKFPELDLYIIHPHPELIFPNRTLTEIRITGINTEKNYLLETYRYSERVFEALVSLNPDVIYSQGLSVWYKARRFSKKLIINPHGLEPYQAIGMKNKIMGVPFRLIFNNLFRKAKVVISLGGGLTTILKRVISSSDKIVEIPNAVILPSQPKKKIFNKGLLKGLFLARFAHNKGIDILFSAIDELNQRGYADKYHFVLGGKGPLYEYYKQRNTADNVTLLGFVDDADIEKTYESADFFVFPTLFEGMPTVVLEAMCYGLPVIVSDVGATKVLVDYTNGIIIQPGSVNSLVSALEKFQEFDSLQLENMSKAAIQKVTEKFTWQVVAKAHLDLFVDLSKAES